MLKIAIILVMAISLFGCGASQGVKTGLAGRFTDTIQEQDLEECATQVQSQHNSENRKRTFWPSMLAGPIGIIAATKWEPEDKTYEIGVNCLKEKGYK